jgi:hypothetical protein
MGEKMKPFIKVGDRYINISAIIYIRVLEEDVAAVWIAFDTDGKQGMRVTGQQAEEFLRLISPLVSITA